MKTKTKNILIILLIIILIITNLFTLYYYFKEKQFKKTITYTYEHLYEDFDVNPGDLTITTAEGNFGRDGYFRAEGTDQNGNLLKFSNSWEWCSSSGAGCGRKYCISAPSPENNIHYYLEVNNPEENYIYNNSKTLFCSYLERNKCNDFERVENGRSILSWAYTGGREVKIIPGDFNC